jgi:hypothetical protein
MEAVRFRIATAITSFCVSLIDPKVEKECQEGEKSVEAV